MVAASVGVIAAGLWATAASAHVEIDNAEQPVGGLAMLHFLVPDESDTATTVKVEIAIPASAVLTSVLPRTAGAWKATTETRQLATPVKTEAGEVSQVVSKVTFTGGTIAPGQIEQFDIQVGPLPDAVGVSVAFPAVQTYDSGEVVRWIDPVVEGQAEPAHPTPLVKLTAASGASGRVNSKDSDILAVAALAVGALGTLLGVGAVVGARKRI